MSQTLQEILTWEINTIEEFSSSPGTAERHTERSAEGGSASGDRVSHLMEGFEVASAVSPTISMWCIVKQWAAYHENIHRFLTEVSSRLRMADIAAGL